MTSEEAATKAEEQDQIKHPAQPKKQENKTEEHHSHHAADARVSRMGTESIPKLITEFAIPAIAGTIVNAAYNLIDSIFLGNAMGELGLATTTVAMPIMTVFLAIGMLVGAGGNALAALRLGQGRKDLAEHVLGNTVTLCLFIWVFFIVVASIPPLLDGLLTLSSATDDVRPYAARFIRIICYGFILQSIGMGVNNFIRTAGAPNRALGTITIGAIACTAFNYLFVIQLGWGVEGSALATVCGQACSCVAVLWYFVVTKNTPIKLRLKYMRPQMKLCMNIAALGAAMFFMQVGAAIVSFVTNKLVVQYGAASPLGADNALAVIGVVMRVAMFTVMPLAGMSMAIQPILGFNYGARNFDRVRKTLLDGILAATTIAIAMWAVVHIWPEQIVNLFGITNDELVAFTVYALKVQLFALPIVGAQIVGSGYFQATGQPLKSTVLSLTRQIIFLLPVLVVLPMVLPLIMPQFIGLDAIYMAAPISDVLSLIMTGIFDVRELRKLKMKESGELLPEY